ncbi:uncharacterized protein ACBR49_001764 [Aulostomus maculatus]
MSSRENQSLELHDGLEIYIPQEAEVKSVSVHNLQPSVLRGMGLSESKGFKMLVQPPDGIQISPAVLRRKGQKPAAHTGNCAKENIPSEFRVAQKRYSMSVVSTNYEAFEVLKNIRPGIVTTHTSILSTNSNPQTRFNYIVIYNGQLYLIIRNTKRKRCEPQLAAQSSPHSASAVSSHQQEKEPLSDDKLKKKVTAQMEKRRKKLESHADVHMDSSSPGEDEGEQTAGEAALGQEDGEANNDRSDNQNSSQWWSSKEPLDAPSAFSTSQEKSDFFKELGRKEKIELIKAKIRQKEGPK